MMVLIPFKAGHWFKPSSLDAKPNLSDVLIPFKAGHWFKPDETDAQILARLS